MKARKRFGQHFLEPAWVDKVVRAIDPKPDQRFLEIGPGRGALTRPLAARAAHVTAVEIDRDLARDASPLPNVSFINADILEVRPEVVGLRGAGALRVAGNLPYNVASPILTRLVEWCVAGVAITDATVMVQREVADRLAASPGTRDYGVLTIRIARHATVERLLALPPGAFRPPPKVHSALVRLRFHAPRPAVADEGLLATIVNTAFTHRRKTISNALAAVGEARGVAVDAALARALVEPSRRPETLTIVEWARLADVFAAA